MYTRDGILWTAVSLPKVDGTKVGGILVEFRSVMTLDARGALIAVVGTPLATSEQLEVLDPRSNSWCAAKELLPAGTKSVPVLTLQSSKTNLVVEFVSPIRVRSGYKAMAVSFPLSKLNCQS
jgi:hypothetical protein